MNKHTPCRKLTLKRGVGAYYVLYGIRGCSSVDIVPWVRIGIRAVIVF